MKLGDKVTVQVFFTDPGIHEGVLVAERSYDLAKGFDVKLDNGRVIFICTEERSRKREAWRLVRR